MFFLNIGYKLEFFLVFMVHIQALSMNIDSSQVNFINGSFETVLTQAKRINKPVFIDVYTVWCGPCKVMRKEAFTSTKVGSFLNENFVCYAIDAEKGEGKTIAREYGVNMYPTLLFLLPDGTLIQKTTGYEGIEPLLDDAKKALSILEDKKSLSFYKQQFDAGERSNDFLLNYIEKCNSLELPTGPVLEIYLGNLIPIELKSQTILDLIARSLSTTDSKGYSLLIDAVQSGNHQTQFIEKAIDGLNRAWWSDHKKVINMPNDNHFQKLLDRYKSILELQPDIDKKRIPIIVENRSRNYFAKTHNLSKYRPFGQQFAKRLMAISDDSLAKSDASLFNEFIKDISQLPDSTRKATFERHAQSRRHTHTNFLASDLNEIAQVFLTINGNRTDLLMALGWIKRALQVKISPIYISTQARIVYKLGDTNKGIALQKQAIKLAQSESKEMDSMIEELGKMTSKTLK
jgi:thiol-disulfide isomerase/thioredoxin